MAQSLSFKSPLPLVECVQRLRHLAEQRDFVQKAGRSTIKIEIKSLLFDQTKSKTTFFLSAKNGLYTRFPILVSFKLHGELQQASEKTRLHGVIQLDKLLLTALKFLVFWGIVGAFAFMGILSEGTDSTSIVGAVLVFFLAGLGYVWSLYRAYRLGMKAISGLVFQALESESPLPAADQGFPNWIADLS